MGSTRHRIPWFATPAVPAAAICTLAFATVGLGGVRTNWTLVGGAFLVALAVVAAAWRTDWSRVPSSTVLLIPIYCDLVIALLRHALGGSTSGFTPLLILPVVWVGLLLGRREVMAIAACTSLLLALPILLVGAPMYPGNGWRGVLLWSIVALVVGFGANEMMSAEQHQTALADARAQELDRLVATQTAISTADVDADTVTAMVVEEARRLTGADAAVVAVAEGAHLVYRAVSGRAHAHAGMRIPAETAISGSALRTGEIFTSRDTWDDARVDREACRRVGARSLLVVPLRNGTRSTGVLEVHASTTDAFRDEHANVLSLLANMIGTALDRAELIGKLSRQAVTDDLTGLANRRAWYEALGRALRRAHRSRAPLSVIALDLDGLKQVNDEHGHAAGDRFLHTVTAAWSSVLRQTDVLGRIGGDEFAVILEGADGRTAADVLARLDGCFEGGPVASAGIATWDGDEDETTLVSRADASMYEQKQTRRLLVR